MKEHYEIEASSGWEQIHGSVVVVSLSGGKIAVFSGIEYTIWIALTEHKSQHEILRNLSAAFDAPEEKMATDLSEFMENLQALGFVRRITC